MYISHIIYIIKLSDLMEIKYLIDIILVIKLSCTISKLKVKYFCFTMITAKL